jgi:hypothetical protein
MGIEEEGLDYDRDVFSRIDKVELVRRVILVSAEALS